jgi:hypothetical protein
VCWQADLRAVAETLAVIDVANPRGREHVERTASKRETKSLAQLKAVAIAPLNIAPNLAIRDLSNRASYLDAADLFPVFGGSVNRDSNIAISSEIGTMLA